jgi:hypothetical protein
MPPPDAGTLHAFQAEMYAVGFPTGTAAVDDMAWEAAWDGAETLLGTNLLTGTVGPERHIWPRGWVDWDTPYRYLQLAKTYLVSVTTATLTHDLGECDCGTDDVSACVLPYDLRRSVVEVRPTDAGICAGCGCVLCNKEAWIDVTYVAGVWNTLGDIPATVKLAIATLAQEWKQIMATAGASAASALVTQWSSMDYSETKGLQVKTAAGPSPAANLAAGVFRRYKVNRMVGLRGRPSVTG